MAKKSTAEQVEAESRQIRSMRQYHNKTDEEVGALALERVQRRLQSREERSHGEYGLEDFDVYAVEAGQPLLPFVSDSLPMWVHRIEAEPGIDGDLSELPARLYFVAARRDRSGRVRQLVVDMQYEVA